MLHNELSQYVDEPVLREDGVGCREGSESAPLPFFLFPGYRSEVTGLGLTDILHLNNLSGYVNDLIPGKRLLVEHISQNDSRVCIAAAFLQSFREQALILELRLQFITVNN